MDERASGRRPASGVAAAGLVGVAATAGATWELLRFSALREGCVTEGACDGTRVWATVALAVAFLAGGGALVVLVRGQLAGGFRGPRHAAAAAVGAAAVAIAAGAVALAGGQLEGRRASDCGTPLAAACRDHDQAAYVLSGVGVGLVAWGLAMLLLALVIRRRRAAAG